MGHRNWATALISFCIKLPITIVVVLFAVSNWKPVSMELWPLPGALDAPLSLIFLLAVVAGFILGAVIAWTGELGHKMRANRAEKRAEDLERELAVMRIREEEIRAQVPASPKRPALVDKRAS
ncbi:LapA family protein [Thalassobaculum sp. OXR-137]|uniref:LapA family protein n=1 Tax=Thalassobaculum sp. OXR-137 TaxID=3100173 RepID=UPI002AC9AB6C|nr:LapA family protein [Thalassobaculum sp. OXR-137]WPZ36688.1 LapA family protein [Thalassobaculum sp. OXR-137]